MFQGETAITIDEKGRLAIPTGQREALACAQDPRLVLTYNPFESGCLWLFPHAQWERNREWANQLPKHKAEHRTLQRKLVGAAAIVEPDGNGRISIPASMRNAVGIERKAVLLGMGNKFELWSEQAHLQQVQQTLGDDIDLGEDLPSGIL